MMTGSRYATSPSCARIQRNAVFAIATVVSVVLTVLVSACTVAYADSHRVYAGRYIVTLPQQPTLQNGVALAASRRLPRNTQIRSMINSHVALVERNAGSITSTSAIKIIPLDPADSFCKDAIAAGTAISCSPDYVVTVAALPNDPNFARLYGLSAAQGMDAPRAWELTTGSQEVVVGVVDTGIDYTHPDLAANMWTNPGEVPGNGLDDDRNGVVDDVFGYNAISNSGDPRDDNIHGTHCAGTIGAVGNNGLGVVGVNQTVRLMALKFLDSSGSGSLGNAIKAIDYAIAIKQKYGIGRMVLNNSWGGGGFSQPLHDAIDRARAAGIVFVAAAGNESNDNDVNPSYPAGYDISNVVSVAAVDKNGNLANFSNYGASSVDIAAAGVDILSTSLNGGYALLSGTSMATPHVSGALALLWSHNGSLSAQDLITRLYESGRGLTTLYDSTNQAALVRTQRAVDVGRMLYGEVAPLPSGGSEPPPCGYDIATQNLAATGEAVDSAADGQTIVNQADEGSFYAVPLKFTFPFFRGSANVLYLSPNGVVYTKAPVGLDYQVGARAPYNTIAALHSDLTPTKAHHGIRVYSGPDKATIMWTHEHYASQGQGDVQVRLTIYPSGVIKSSVSFGPAGELVELRRTVLGDPLAAVPSAAKALIGIGGPSGSYSSTLDIAAAQKALLPTGSEPLILGVTMNPNCAADDGGSGGSAVVSKISLREQTKRRKSKILASALIGSLQGSGSGTVPVNVTINRTQCQQTAQVSMKNGSAQFTAKLPKIPVRLTFSSSSASRTLRMKSMTSRQFLSASRIQQMCRTVINGLK